MSDKPDWASITAAQMWCEERFAHKEMDAAFAYHIAAALRKAKAEGLREAAKRLHDCGECDASDHEDEFLDEADKIEGGNEAAA